MPATHFLLALAVVVIWGSNFVVIRFGVEQMPPLLFAALRFLLAMLPGVFLLRRPAVPWRNLAAYGLFIGVGQFGVLFIAMRGQITPGLASLVVQTQVFFTLMLAMRQNGEGMRPFQWVSLALAASGLVVILMHTDGATTPLGLGLVLLAAFSWACGNMVGKRAGAVDPLAYQVWSSVFAVPPLFALCLLVDGPEAVVEGLRSATLPGWAAVVWQSWANTLFGYGAWAWLLARHPAPTIVPLALLVPVFGMSTASLVLGESLPAWKLAAIALVIAGLTLNLLWPRLKAWLQARLPAR